MYHNLGCVCTGDVVLQQANDQQSLLLTANKDFGEMVYRQGLVHAGVILLRLSGLTTITKEDIVVKVFDDHASEFVGAFSVIVPSIVRIRRQRDIML
jgi:predicted nuclease of predicted toxin-antitoxin system